MGSPDTSHTTGPVVLPPASFKLADTLVRAYDLPFTLVLEVPALEFTVGSLMRLHPGSIIRTGAQHNEDIFLKVNGQIVGLAEFDIVGDHLAVRLTRIV